ncbi:MAG TPA: NAD(P)/FAD-dependent oxidoreductase [Thermoanaerobaculia bacterium]|nr:NAD(P)/FAD-dependent oxidoreductase [Thermoanaerobaculia bacterium]
MTPRQQTTLSSQPNRLGTGAADYDAIVVGARVAGAATAMLLARRGRRVLLVDRRRPQSDTLSTHALMRAGVLQLSRWGLLDQVIAAGTPAIHQNIMRYGDVVDAIEIKPKAGVDALYAPRRTVLDTILVEAAEAAGVEVRFGVTVDGLAVDSQGRVAGIAARDASGSFEATARYTVGADGIRSVVALGTGAPVLHRGTGSSAVVYGYFEGAGLPTEFEFSYRTGASGGFIPTNDGQVCVWAGAPSARWLGELRGDPDLGFARMLATCAPEAVDVVKAARLVGRLHGFAGEVSYLRQPWGPGWALVGDASHFKDPISAHGITDALRDAELLAIAIDEAMTGDAGGNRETAALERYHETRDRLSLRMHRASDAVARYDWTSETVRDLLIEMAKSMGDEVELLSKLDAPSEAKSDEGERTLIGVAPLIRTQIMIGGRRERAAALIETTAPADHPAVAFLDALRRRDWASLEQQLAADVWMRALLPKRIHEENTAIGVVAIYQHWYDVDDCQMIEAEHHTMAGRDYVRYRFLVRPEFAPEHWHLVEQVGFCRVKEGRITRIDVVCTGFHPVQGTVARNDAAAKAA